MIADNDEVWRPRCHADERTTHDKNGQVNNNGKYNPAYIFSGTTYEANINRNINDNY